MVCTLYHQRCNFTDPGTSEMKLYKILCCYNEALTLTFARILSSVHIPQN